MEFDPVLNYLDMFLLSSVWMSRYLFTKIIVHAEKLSQSLK